RGRANQSGARLSHDCATVDDWAGALLLDLGTGRPVGIHVAGGLDRLGVGVASADVLEGMKVLGLPAATPVAGPMDEEDVLESRRRTAEDYADRAGYQPGF